LAAAHKKTVLSHDENATAAVKAAKGGLATKAGAALAKRDTNAVAGAKKRSALGDVSNVQSQVSISFVFF
jgi:hypothetical protein